MCTVGTVLLTVLERGGHLEVPFVVYTPVYTLYIRLPGYTVVGTGHTMATVPHGCVYRCALLAGSSTGIGLPSEKGVKEAKTAVSD